MSKASDFASHWNEQGKGAFLQFVTDHVIARVSLCGELLIWDNDLSPSEALEFADWLKDTFE